MSMIPKNMDDFLRIAKDMSVKVADTVSKLCESYVSKAKAASAQASAEAPAAEAAPAADTTVAEKAPEEPKID